MKPALLTLTALAAVTAGVVGAGRLADLLPAAAVALCMVVLTVMCLVGLAR